MVEMIGELIIVESMLKHSRELSSTTVNMRNTLGQLGKISRDLQNAAMRMRTVPVHTAFQKIDGCSSHRGSWPRSQCIRRSQ